MKISTTPIIRRALCSLILLVGITENMQAINSYYWVSRDWASGSPYGAYWSYNNSWSTSSGGSGVGSSISPQNYLNFDGSAAAPLNGLYNNTNDFSNAGGFQIYFKNTIPAAYNLYGNPITFYDNSTIDPNIQNEGTTYTPTINFAITNGNYNGTYRVLNINLNTSPAQGPLIFNGPIYGSAVDANSRVINIGGGNITFNNTIANGAGGGTLGLTLLGAGTTTLTASNTFTGDMTVNAGTLVLATNSALAAGANFIRLGDTAGSTGANLNLNGGNTVSTSINVRSGSSGGKIIANTSGTAGNATFAGGLYLDADVTLFANSTGGNTLSSSTLDLKNQTLTIDGTGSNVISGTLQQSTGSGKLVKNNTGALTLSGNNTFSGGTTLNTGGMININSATALGTGAFTIGGSTTVFDNTSGGAISNANNNALTMSGGSPTFTGTTNLNFGTGIVTISGANRTVTVNANTLTLGGGVTDSSGARKLTKAGAGTLVLNGAAGVWTGGSSVDAGILIVGNDTALGTGTLALNGGNLFSGGTARTLANSVLVTASSGIGGTNSFTFNGIVTNSGGSRTLTITNSGSTTFAGNVFLSDDNTTAGRTQTFAGSAPVTISGAIANNNAGNTVAVGLTWSDSATLTLSGTNTFTGQLTVQSGGVLSVSSISNALGAVSPIQLGGGSANGTLLYTGPGETTDRKFNFGASSAGSGQVIDQSGTGLLKIVNTFGSSGSTAFTLTLQGSTAGAGEIANVISNNAAGTVRSLVKAGTGTWTLSGVNTYSGATTISNGTLTIGGAGQLGSGAYSPNILNNGAFNYASSAAQTLSGIISGAGSLTNSGTGKLTLSGINTYSGPTIVSAGELVGQTGGSNSSSAVTVSAGATNGVSVVTVGGQWACASLSYGSGTAYADFNFNNNAPSPSAAPLQVNGNLAFNGTLNVIVRGNPPIGTYPLIKYTGTLSGTPPTSAFSLPAGVTAAVVNNTANKSIDLNVTGNTSEVFWAVGSAAWDTATANWKNSAGNSTNYTDGDVVVLDDTASGASPISLTLSASVTPSSITANLTNKSYTIVSNGFAILGSGSLIKNGSGTLAIGTTNLGYTGSITVNGGTLSLSNGASVGTGTMTLGNGTTFTMGSGGVTFPVNPIFIPAGASVSISGNGALGDAMGGAITSGDNASIINVISTFSLSSTTRQLDSFLGMVTINSSQTLRFSANSSGNTYGGTNTTFNVIGSLQPRNAGNTIVMGALTGSGSVGPNQTASVGNSTYIVGTNNASTTFSGKFVDFGPGSATNQAIVTKVGTGTFTVSGNSAHSGATTVNVGSLMGVTGGSFSNSPVTINVGATNGVSVTTPGSQWVCTNLTYAAAGTEYVVFAFGANTPSTTVAPLFVQNNLAISGTLNIIVTGGSTTIPVGTYPLIKYGNTLSGTPPTVPFSLPQYVSGILTNDTANKIIALIVTNVITPTLAWSAGTGTWETNSLNWTNTLAGALTNWADGNLALFDDTASGAGPFTVTLNTNVNPLNVLFTNITKNYTLTGTGSINGSGTFTKAGAGTLALATTNSFTGGTVISGGTLQGSSATLLGSIANNAALVFDQSFNGSNSAVISGTGSLTKQNSGLVALGGNNNYTGKTFVNAGTLAISAGASVGGNPGSATTNQLTINGGTLLATNGAATITLPVNAGITVGAAGATIDVAANTTLDYPAQPISGTGTLTKNGAGVFQIDEGTASSTYTNLTLNAGTIAFNKSSGGLGAGSLIINGGTIRTTAGSSRTPDNSAILVNADFTLGSPTTAAISFANGGAWTLANGTRTITVDTITATITGVIGDGGNNYQLVKAGSGTLVLNNANTFSGGISMTAGNLILGNNGAAGTGSTVAYSGGSVQVGNGITITNKFDNGSANTSDLMMDCPTGTGVWAGPVTSGGAGGFRPGTSGGTLIFTGTGSLGSKNFIVPRGTVIFATNANFSSSGTTIAFGRSTSGSGTSVTVQNSAVLSLTGANGFQLGGAQASPGPIVFTLKDSAAVSSGAQLFDIHNSTSGTATTAVNLYGGTLTVGSFVKSQTGGSQTSTINFNGGSLKAGQSTGSFLPALSGLTANVSTNGAFINDNGFNITIAQALSHDATLGATVDGGLMKSGAGIMILSGTETYSGTTTVNGGTLLISGVLGTNSVTVNTNTTLSGNGIINGATAIQLGGTVQPGLGSFDTSTLVISNSLTLAGQAVLALNRTNAQTAAKISGITTVTYGGTLIATNVGSALQAGDTFTLFQAATYAGSFTTVVLPALGSGLVWDTSQLGVNGSVSVISSLAITMTPATTNLVYGNSVALTANATGASPLAYQWYDNGTNLISGATNSTLTLTIPSVSASGNYTVIVTNVYGSASKFVTVTITPAPLGITANSLSKTYGQTITFVGTEFSTSGLLGGDTVTNVSLASSGATGTAPVFSYAIIPSAAAGSGLGNYTITYTNGTLTVNPLAVGILGTRTYDGTTNAPYSILSITNIVGSDSVNVASGLGGLAGATVGSQAITSFGTLTLGGASATNYTLASASGVVIITNAYAGGVLTSSANPNGYRDSVTFTNILPTDSTGYVLFNANNVQFSSNSLASGTAISLTITNLPRGTNVIAAIYSGDVNYLTSTNSLNQVVTNHPPVANANTYARNNLPSWKILISDLLTNASDVDGDTLSLTAVGTSTNGVALDTNSFPGYVAYYNSNTVTDQFTYFVADGYGGTNSAVITLNSSSPASSTGQVASLTITGGVASMTFLGIPGFTYNVQRATNDVSGPWFTIWTTNAPAGGAFQFDDSGVTAPSAYYRLSW